EAGRNRAHPELHAWRESRLSFVQTLGHLLAREVDVRSIAEDRRDLRETVARKRARGFESRRTGKRRFNRKRDLLFDFDACQCWCDSIDLPLNVGNVRDGVDRELG